MPCSPPSPPPRSRPRRHERLRPAGTGHGGVGVPAEVAVVIATSGSTGEPKGVQLAAGALLHSARPAWTGSAPGPASAAVPLPASHVAARHPDRVSLVSGHPGVGGSRCGTRRTLAGSGCAPYTSLVRPSCAGWLAAGADLTGFATSCSAGPPRRPGCLTPPVRRCQGGHPYGMSETCGGCVYDGVPLTGVSVRTGTAAGSRSPAPSCLRVPPPARPDRAGHGGRLVRHLRRGRGGRGGLRGGPRPRRRDDQYRG